MVMAERRQREKGVENWTGGERGRTSGKKKEGPAAQRTRSRKEEGTSSQQAIPETDRHHGRRG